VCGGAEATFSTLTDRLPQAAIPPNPLPNRTERKIAARDGSGGSNAQIVDVGLRGPDADTGMLEYELRTDAALVAGIARG
jgi:hypothetical protein